VTMLIDTNQHAAARYIYDPFGRTLSKSGPLADVNRYQFSSKPLHDRSGLYDYLYRWYAPEIQRWLNRDPIGEFGFELLIWTSTLVNSETATIFHPNGHTFLLNAPNTYVDPTGLSIQSMCEICTVTPAMLRAHQAYRDAIKRLDEKYGEGNWPDNIEKYMDDWLKLLIQKFPSCVVKPAVETVPGTFPKGGPVVRPKPAP